MVVVSLFDDLKREDPSPARPGEDSFAFLNRVDTPFWAKVRRLLEEWFGHYPAEGRDVSAGVDVDRAGDCKWFGCEICRYLVM